MASPVHGYFLQHVDLSRYASANVLLWGITLLCHAATFNFGSLATARFFLGVFEGSWGSQTSFSPHSIVETLASLHQVPSLPPSFF